MKEKRKTEALPFMLFIIKKDGCKICQMQSSCHKNLKGCRKTVSLSKSLIQYFTVSAILRLKAILQQPICKRPIKFKRTFNFLNIFEGNLESPMISLYPPAWPAALALAELL